MGIAAYGYMLLDEAQSPPVGKDHQLGGATHLWRSFFRDMVRDREPVHLGEIR